jgi:hypothetical protein
MSEQKPVKWYVDLAASANTFAEELGLDDFATKKLRDIMITKGKEQYMAGNRSGIRWARLNPPKVMNVAVQEAATA